MNQDDILGRLGCLDCLGSLDSLGSLGSLGRLGTLDCLGCLGVPEDKGGSGGKGANGGSGGRGAKGGSGGRGVSRNPSAHARDESQERDRWVDADISGGAVADFSSPGLDSRGALCSDVASDLCDGIRRSDEHASCNESEYFDSSERPEAAGGPARHGDSHFSERPGDSARFEDSDSFERLDGTSVTSDSD